MTSITAPGGFAVGGKDSLMAPWFAYAVVLMAACNAALRPTVELPITPYYLLAPVVILLLLASMRRFGVWLLVYALAASYGLLVGTAFGTPWGAQFAQLLKYLQLLTFFGLLRWLSSVDPQAGPRLQRTLALLTALVFALALFQALTGLEIPTVVNEESNLWLNTIFFTPNDLALFLGGVVCLVLASNASWAMKLLFVALVTALNVRNDAKAVLIATALMLVMLLLLRACEALRWRPWVGLMAFTALIASALVYHGDTEVEFADMQFNLVGLLIDPASRILALEPYGLEGSVFDRADALIYGLQAFKASSYLGLGPAGSVQALSLPQYDLITAKSLHNAIAEVFIEFGPLAMLGMLLLLPPVVRALKARRPMAADRGRLMLFVAAPMLSVSQSSGFISNYAFWLTVFLIWWPSSAHGLRLDPRRRRAVAQPSIGSPLP